MVCNGICKIIDLGFSRKLATDPRSGVLQTDVGTFDFKAPEIINRQKYGLKVIWI